MSTGPDGGLPAGPAAALGVPDPEIDDDTPPPAGPVTNLAVAGFVLALGVVTAVGAAGLGLGTPSQPGPGTWPLIVALLLVTLGAVLATTARSTADTERFTRSSLGVALGIGTMIAFAAAIGYIGFEIPAALLTFVWLRVLGGEGWRLSVLTSLALTGAFYLIFVVGLSVNIPHLF